MRATLDIPLLLSLFIASLLILPGEEVVEIDYSGIISIKGQKEEFTGKARLDRSDDSFKISGAISSKADGETKIHFEIINDQLTVTDVNGEKNTKQVDDMFEVNSFDDYLLFLRQEFIGGEKGQINIDQGDTNTVYALAGFEGYSCIVTKSNLKNRKGAIVKADLTLDDDHTFSITIDKTVFE
jgi:hypothetical protein